MNSAFGIDHGYEVEKAFGLGAIGGALGRGASKLGTGIQGRTMGNFRSAVGQARKMPAGPMRAGAMGGARAAAGGQMRAGGALQRLGGGMQKRPGLTGGLAVGGVGAAGGGLFASRRR